MKRSIVAMGASLALALGACQPTNQQLEDLAKQQDEILAKLTSLEANQKKLLASATPAARRQRPKEDYNKVYKIDIAGSPFLGKADAPVVIVEWSDFQCPYCARATPPLKEVQKKYGDDKVKLVFKHFPLSFHKGAKPAAIASLAAADQGKFWEFHDVLFKNQRALDASKMNGYAAEAGLDVEQFKQDMTANQTKYAKAVDADFRQGQSVGVRGTPTLYIGGKRVANRTVQGMSKMIDTLLKEQAAGS